MIELLLPLSCVSKQQRGEARMPKLPLMPKQRTSVCVAVSLYLCISVSPWYLSTCLLLVIFPACEHCADLCQSFEAIVVAYSYHVAVLFHVSCSLPSMLLSSGPQKASSRRFFVGVCLLTFADFSRGRPLTRTHTWKEAWSSWDPSGRRLRHASVSVPSRVTIPLLLS